MTGLPTPAEMLAYADGALGRAVSALDDADDWLRSDWPPGSTMTDGQAARRTAMFRAIGEAKAAIEQARR